MYFHGNHCITQSYTGTNSSEEEASFKLPTHTTNQRKKGENKRQGNEREMNRKKQTETERDRQIGSDSSEQQKKSLAEGEEQAKTKKSRVTSAGTFLWIHLLTGMNYTLCHLL